MTMGGVGATQNRDDDDNAAAAGTAESKVEDTATNVAQGAQDAADLGTGAQAVADDLGTGAQAVADDLGATAPEESLGERIGEPRPRR